MNRKILLLIMLLPLISKAQSLEDLDLKFGYKDITFDMPSDSVLKAIKARSYLTGKTEKFITYYLPSAYRTFSDFKCQAYLMVQRNTKLLHAFYLTLNNPDKENFRKLIIFFTNLYGAPTETSDVYHTALWKGAKVELSIKYESYPESLSVTILNKIADEELDKIIMNRLDSTKDDF